MVTENTKKLIAERKAADPDPLLSCGRVRDPKTGKKNYPVPVRSAPAAKK